MVSGLAKKTEVASTVDSSRTCFDGRCGENKCDDGETPTARGRVFLKEPIYYGCEQKGKQELLYM